MDDITNGRSSASPRTARSRHVNPLDELGNLLRFYDERVIDGSGGFHWLDSDGQPIRQAAKPLWLNARFTYCYALAELLGHSGAHQAVEHGLDFLDGPIRDHAGGGWFASDDPQAAKEAYGQAHVVLAAAAAARAGHPRAAPLLRDALDAAFRFYEVDQGLFADEFSADWATLDDYRGANSNMHMVEALLAASAVLEDSNLLDTAVGVLDRLLGEFAAGHDWRVPEHFTRDWRPLLRYNHDNPKNPFRPYGYTIGHSFEWARLSLNAWTATGKTSERHLQRAINLYRRGVAEGLLGNHLVFSVDVDGSPFDLDRYHWPLAEAISAAGVLRQVTGDDRLRQDESIFWRIAANDFIDAARGGWIHQLDPFGGVTTTVWEGKPDLYHALQACLLGALPPAPDVATALAEWGSDRGGAALGEPASTV